MVIKINGQTGVVISMSRIDKSIFSFVIEESNGVFKSFIGDIYDMKIVNCPGNRIFLEDIKKDS